MKGREADANKLANSDYTQIYMFYNRKKNSNDPNDKGELKTRSLCYDIHTATRQLRKRSGFAPASLFFLLFRPFAFYA